jgi:hypothetical protein
MGHRAVLAADGIAGGVAGCWLVVANVGALSAPKARSLYALRLQPHRQRQRPLPRMRRTDTGRRTKRAATGRRGTEQMTPKPLTVFRGVRVVILAALSLAAAALAVFGPLSYIMESGTYAAYPADPGLIMPDVGTSFCRVSLQLAGSKLQVRYDRFTAARQGTASTQPPGFEWRRRYLLHVYGRRSPEQTVAFLFVPFWIPALLLAAWPLLGWARPAWIRHRRRRPGLCLYCGYDLTGNTSGRCPECGSPVAARAPENISTTGDRGQRA